MPAFEHAVAATRGARDYQEDSARFWPFTSDHGGGSEPAPAIVPSGVAVLADGMGGHAGGALASQMVCDHFIKVVADQNEPGADDTAGVVASEGKPPDARLLLALQAANTAVASKVSENPLLSGMGSTVIGALFDTSGIAWVSVGDSPLYLFRRGEVAVLNEDHSLAPELDRLVAAGKLTEDEARRDPRRHMLRSAVTGDEIDLVDLSTKPLALEVGDYVVLASDGIATLDDSEIARVINGYAADGADAVARALIRAVEAMREPFQDNTTVLVVRRLED